MKEIRMWCWKHKDVPKNNPQFLILIFVGFLRQGCKSVYSMCVIKRASFPAQTISESQVLWLPRQRTCVNHLLSGVQYAIQRGKPGLSITVPGLKCNSSLIPLSQRSFIHSLTHFNRDLTGCLLCFQYYFEFYCYCGN